MLFCGPVPNRRHNAVTSIRLLIIAAKTQVVAVNIPMRDIGVNAPTPRGFVSSGETSSLRPFASHSEMNWWYYCSVSGLSWGRDRFFDCRPRRNLFRWLCEVEMTVCVMFFWWPYVRSPRARSGIFSEQRCRFCRTATLAGILNYCAQLYLKWWAILDLNQ